VLWTPFYPNFLRWHAACFPKAAREEPGEFMRMQMPDAKMPQGEFFAAYVQNAGKWHGCDWPTAFGASKLNLNGLRQDQATLLAGATSRSEADDWRAAADWLAQIERDAKQADAKAARAAELAEAGRLTEALRLAEEVCAIEGQYHANLVWRQLREAIATALAEQE
jgi:hypothetical protein